MSKEGFFKYKKICKQVDLLENKISYAKNLRIRYTKELKMIVNKVAIPLLQDFNKLQKISKVSNDNSEIEEAAKTIIKKLRKFQKNYGEVTTFLAKLSDHENAYPQLIEKLEGYSKKIKLISKSRGEIKNIFNKHKEGHNNYKKRDSLVEEIIEKIGELFDDFDDLSTIPSNEVFLEGPDVNIDNITNKIKTVMEHVDVGTDEDLFDENLELLLNLLTADISDSTRTQDDAHYLVANNEEPIVACSGASKKDIYKMEVVAQQVKNLLSYIAQTGKLLPDRPTCLDCSKDFTTEIIDLYLPFSSYGNIKTILDRSDRYIIHKDNIENNNPFASTMKGMGSTALLFCGTLYLYNFHGIDGYYDLNKEKGDFNINSMTFNPRGDKLIICMGGNLLVFYPNGKKLAQSRLPFGINPPKLLAATENRIIAIYGSEYDQPESCYLISYDYTKNESFDKKALQLPTQITSITQSAKPGLFFMGSKEGIVFTLTIKPDGTPTYDYYYSPRHNEPVNNMSISPNGRYLLVTWNGKIKLIDTFSKKKIRLKKMFKGKKIACFDNNGNIITMNSGDDEREPGKKHSFNY